MKSVRDATAVFDCAAVKAQCPIFVEHAGLHYLDNAATTQCPAAVLDAVHRHETQARANVSRGVYRLAEAATDAYEQARRVLAQYIQAPDLREVVFTSGTTASINLVAHTFGQALKEGDEVVLSVAEHHSNLVPWQLLARRRGIRLRFLPVTEEGRIDTGALDTMVRERCRLIAITHASNVTGAITDIASVVTAARAVGAKVLLDGAQMAPRGGLNMVDLDADFYAFSGHKMFGPNGIGVLWNRRPILDDLLPAFGGGGMVYSVTTDGAEYADPPARYEAGTPPIAQAIGLAAAASWIADLDQAMLSAHIDGLTERILSGLTAIPGLRIIGPATTQQRLGLISFDIEGVHPHDISQILDAHNVAVRGGHHCAQPLMEAFAISSTARASLAPYNDDSDIDALLSGLDDAIGKLR